MLQKIFALCLIIGSTPALAHKTDKSHYHMMDSAKCVYDLQKEGTSIHAIQEVLLAGPRVVDGNGIDLGSGYYSDPTIIDPTKNPCWFELINMYNANIDEWNVHPEEIFHGIFYPGDNTLVSVDEYPVIGEIKDQIRSSSISFDVLVDILSESKFGKVASSQSLPIDTPGAENEIFIIHFSEEKLKKHGINSDINENQLDEVTDNGRLKFIELRKLTSQMTIFADESETLGISSTVRLISDYKIRREQFK